MEKNELDLKIKGLINNFIQRTRQSLGENLKSVILYGSLAGGQHHKKHSDINILVVLNKPSAQALGHIADIKRKAKFAKIEPLVLDADYIKSSTDTFPIEFLSMQESYSVLWGEDYLKDLKIDLKNLRHQCEWELKSKMIQMQRFYVKAGRRDRLISDFLIRMVPSLFVVFKNILRLKSIKPKDRNEILEKTSELFKISQEVFIRLQTARQSNFKIIDPQGDFEKLLSALRSISEQIDDLNL